MIVKLGNTCHTGLRFGTPCMSFLYNTILNTALREDSEPIPSHCIHVECLDETGHTLVSKKIPQTYICYDAVIIYFIHYMMNDQAPDSFVLTFVI